MVTINITPNEMNNKKDINYIKKQLLSDISDYCNKYLTEQHFDKCNKIVNRILVKSKNLLIKYSIPELAAGIVYIICEVNYHIEKSQKTVYTHFNYEPICNYYHVSEFEVISISKKIKTLLEIHAKGIHKDLDYNISELDIKVFGIGMAGIKVINKLILNNIQGITCITISTVERHLKESFADYNLLLQNRDMLNAVNSNIKLLKDNAKYSEVIIFVVDSKSSFEYISKIVNLIDKLNTLKIGVILQDSIINIADGNEIHEVMDAILHYDDFNKCIHMIEKMIQVIHDFSSNDSSTLEVGFEDIRMLLKNKGNIDVSVGSAIGNNCGIKAAEQSIANIHTREVKSLLMSVTASKCLELKEGYNAVEYISRFLEGDTYIIFAYFVDERLINELKVVNIFTYK